MNRVKHYFKWITSKRYRKHLWLRVHLSDRRTAIHILEELIRVMGPGEIYEVMLGGPLTSGRINMALLSRARELEKETKDD